MEVVVRARVRRTIWIRNFAGAEAVDQKENKHETEQGPKNRGARNREENWSQRGDERLIAERGHND